MKQWRRSLLVVALVLLTGALVNVAVAWVLVGAPDSWTPGGTKSVAVGPGQMEPVVAERVRALASRIGGDERLTRPVALESKHGLGWRVNGIAMTTDDPREAWFAVAVEAGWPARSMRSVNQLRPGEREWARSATWPPPRRLLPRGWFSGHGTRDRIPLTPNPAGFAVNTLFYATILALPLSFFSIRRRLRARRGRCPKCGYDLAGLADPATPCPECGAAR